VAISVFARRFDDLSEFQDALEATGAFTDVLSRQLGQEEDGSLRAEIQGYYAGPAQPAAATPASSSEPAKPESDPPQTGGPSTSSRAPRAASSGGGAR
jgi:hypothetical protein